MDEELEIKYLRKLKFEYENQISILKSNSKNETFANVTNKTISENTEKELIKTISQIREHNESMANEIKALDDEIEIESKMLNQQKKINKNLKLIGSQNVGLSSQVILNGQPLHERIETLSNKVENDLAPLLAKILSNSKNLQSRMNQMKKRSTYSEHFNSKSQTLVLAYTLQFLMNVYIKNPTTYVSQSDILCHFQSQYPEIYNLVNQDTLLSIEFQLLESSGLIERLNNDILFRLIQVSQFNEVSTLKNKKK